MNAIISLLMTLGTIALTSPGEVSKRSGLHEFTTVGEPVKNVPSWAKNATIYEVNLRQFSQEGTFARFQNDLPRLKKMGIDILWFMPIHPIGVKNRKGKQGSYYSVQDYKAVHPDHGSLEDFKNLVTAAHKLGMYVIIDWVANHSAFDNVWIEQGHLDWYTLDSAGQLQPPLGTDWWDVADLNYENKAMRTAMIDALKFWVRECDIDGYRCDVADWVPVDFWEEARIALDSVKDVFMLAESETAILHNKAFDMTYAWEFHFIMNDIAQGKKSVRHIREYLEGKAKSYPQNAYRMHFTSNHDENSWKGTEQERLGDAVKTFAVLSATMEGMPLVYNGQEAGMNKRLQFFEKDVMTWPDWSMTDFYTPLLNLKHQNQALWNGELGAPLQIVTEASDTLGFGFHRQRGKQAVFCLFNFSPSKRTVQYRNESFSGKYVELFSRQRLNNKQNKVDLNPWEYRVYVRNR
jgi:glycosidase